MIRFFFRSDTKVRIMLYFCPMEESQRQKKIGGVLQKDLADILQRAASDGGLMGTLISVTKVSVTVDLSVAKVYISVFPENKADELIAGIRSNQPLIRKELAARTRNQLCRMPEMLFYIDDTLSYQESIEKSLRGKKTPLAIPIF